jgi:hypothetical protein
MILLILHRNPLRAASSIALSKSGLYSVNTCSPIQKVALKFWPTSSRAKWECCPTKLFSSFIVCVFISTIAAVGYQFAVLVLVKMYRRIIDNRGFRGILC